MMITVNHIVEATPWRFCAFCDKKESHYTISALPAQETSDSRYIRACIDCFNDLVSGTSSVGCAFCGNLAQYGSTEVKQHNKFGSRTSVDIKYVPEDRVLCEQHFSEIRDKLEEEKIQHTLDEFK